MSSGVTARSLFLRSSLWCLALVFGSVPAFAQSVHVNGTIKDPDQSVVANATVFLGNAHTQLPFQSTSNDAGQYSFFAVPPGTYRLEARKRGFVTAIIPALTVRPGHNVTQDVVFALFGDSFSVTISGGGEGTPTTGYYVENVDQGVLCYR